jgi:CheY-like chemotaxis protein
LQPVQVGALERYAKIEKPVPPAARSLAGLRVLVVEDDTDGRELMSAVLLDAGAVVESAASVPEGFEILRRFHPDLLLSDIGMPDEDGYSLMRRVRALSTAEGGAVPAIALSAFTRPEDQSKALSAGFSLHIGKPVIPAELVRAAHALIASKRSS